jgi:hypothetical protein
MGDERARRSVRIGRVTAGSIHQFVPPRVAPWRVVGAYVAVALAIVALAFAVLGQWNPWSYVVLRQFAGNPFLDVFVALLLATVAHLLGLPVSNGVVQFTRSRTRTWLIVATFAAGILALGASSMQLFRYDPDVVARSDDGQRSVALVWVSHDRQVERQVHVFSGSGAFARDRGSVGLACGTSIKAQFNGTDQIALSTDYGDFTLSLDPTTGVPRNTMGATCTG